MPNDPDRRRLPTDQELAEYRAALVVLMKRCLDSVRTAELRMDAQPVLTRRHE